MKRTIITTHDIKNIVDDMFNGGENSEDILLVDEYAGTQEVKDLAKFLNIQFYDWQNKVETAQENGCDSPEEWLEKISNSNNQAYALVEIINDETTESADIDSGVKTGRISFFIQANKVHNLDYYVQKIRSRYIGEPFVFINSYGNKVKTYFTLGAMEYSEEPNDTQAGYTLVTSCTFTLTYMSDALTYNDIKVEMSLDMGKHYYDMPISQETWQLVTISTPTIKAERPDLSGQLVSAIASMKTFSFFDYNKKLNEAINSLFWSVPAVNINNILTKARENLNIPIKIRMITKDNIYIYEDIVDNIEKVIQNNTYCITSLAVKGNAYPTIEIPLFYNGEDKITSKQLMYDKATDINSTSKQNILSGATLLPTQNAGAILRTTMFIKGDKETDVELTYKANDVNGNLIKTISREVKVGTKLQPFVIDLELDKKISEQQITLSILAKAITSNTTIHVVSDKTHGNAFYIYE